MPTPEKPLPDWRMVTVPPSIHQVGTRPDQRYQRPDDDEQATAPQRAAFHVVS